MAAVTSNHESKPDLIETLEVLSISDNTSSDTTIQNIHELNTKSKHKQLNYMIAFYLIVILLELYYLIVLSYK